MYIVEAVIGTIFVYDRDSGEPRAINDREIGYFMNGLHAEMIVKYSEVLSKELPKKY
ncbi:hypothetical protein [Candidatus Ichthyocystis hellenicum]|uniref:hypothetical protein n=1 Tax=Candidatus Ichthyocystis hellenicum TaxID=1561003 RepID=UPI0015848DE8|nr:hypothetical protein [Candidatus Ichthyocystis hellenicum]